MGYTQRIMEQGFDPILSEMVSILGEQAGLSIDTLLRNALTDGATIDYSGGVSARASLDNTLAHEITFDDFIIQLAELAAADCRAPEGGRFPVIIHPYTWKNLMQDPTFSAMFIEEAPNNAFRTGLIGSLLNCNIYITSNARVHADAGANSTDDVYHMLFIGADSHGVVGFASQLPNLNPDGAGPDMAWGGMTGQSVNSVEIIRKGLGETGFDPLNQRGTLGYKYAFATQVLKSDWIRDLEHLNDFS